MFLVGVDEAADVLDYRHQLLYLFYSIYYRWVTVEIHLMGLKRSSDLFQSDSELCQACPSLHQLELVGIVSWHRNP